MIPIGLKRDNVARLNRDRGGINWPTCARCLQPVDGYGIEHEQRRGDGTREISVFAECRHDPRGGHNGARSKFHRDVKTITVPLTMGKVAFEKSMGLMVFFADASWEPHAAPMGRATPKMREGSRSRRGGRWGL